MATITDLEIYQSAATIIAQRGPNADSHASTRADELAVAGDLMGRDVWLRILTAVEKLQSENPPVGVRAH